MHLQKLEILIGKDALEKIKKQKIAVVGLGGVGSFAVESLARSGISNLLIIDNDIIDITNINRQIMAYQDNIGNKKVLELKNRIKKIDPSIKVDAKDIFLNKDNIDILKGYDYILDCCDTTTTKKEIIKYCLKNKIKFITCMGTANKFEPEKLEIVDIRKTKNDPLAKSLRKWVKEENIKGKIVCISSKELPKKSKELGTTSFLASSAGLLATSYIIRQIIRN